MTRYERNRNQRSHIWRKRREQHKQNRKARNRVARNLPKGPSLPNVDTSLRAPLMQRILLGVAEAFARKRTEPRTNHQQQQAR